RKQTTRLDLPVRELNLTTLLMEILRGGVVVDSITATDSTEVLQVAGRNGVGGEFAAITLDDYTLTEL
ncbi:MAG TPA: hypothetical protein VF596_06170, partial [Pyrinomonadaceae bacterium]